GLVPEDQPPVDLGELLPNRDRPFVQVNVLPSKAKHLTPAKACGQCQNVEGPVALPFQKRQEGSGLLAIPLRLALLLDPGCLNVGTWVSRDEPLPLGVLEGFGEDDESLPHGSWSQRSVLLRVGS